LQVVFADDPRIHASRVSPHTGLLVLDEVGYLSYDSRNADLLFQGGLQKVCAEESRADGACATALIDRIIHHADIITIEGQSYRRRAAEESAAARKTKAKR
jgi:DNA replication protein DnaC